MNPFTQSTVARPMIAAIATPTPSRSENHKPEFFNRARGPAKLLRSLGLAVALAASGAALAVDVNQASLDQLQTVRGIGPKTAQTILDERSRGGPYASFDDLSERVKGIGEKKALSLQQAGLTIGAAGQANSSSSAPSEASRARQSRTKR